MPGWNNPPQPGTPSSEQPQYASIPGRETNVLDPGRGPRVARAPQRTASRSYGGWLVVIVLAFLVAFYLIKGIDQAQGPADGPAHRALQRRRAHGPLDAWRSASWSSRSPGSSILFGKYIILPWLGYTGFSWLTVVSKNLHNFVGPLFIFALAIGFLTCS